jgi:hypothetical protein
MIAPLREETDTGKDFGHQAQERFAHRHKPADSNPFEPLVRHLSELREYVAHYWTVQKDSAKAKVRRAVLWAILGIVAGATAITLMATASALALIGLADALGVLFGDRFWAGKLVVGLGLILLAFAGLALAMYGWSRSSRAHTVQQYESRHARQRSQFGHDVKDRAAV